MSDQSVPMHHASLDATNHYISGAPSTPCSGGAAIDHDETGVCNHQNSPIQFGRPFVLQRNVDHTGVSGTGTVADGVEFPDGTVALRWRGEHASTVVWASLSDALHVHGHNGATRVVWAGPENR